MARLVWDAAGQRRFEFGVDHGVLYRRNEANTAYEAGVPWNGLTGVTQNAEGGESSKIHADNIQYARRRGLQTDKLTLEALYYPEEFAECDGSAVVLTGLKIYQQRRRRFGFSYRTGIGSDTGSDGYFLHIVWNVTAEPSDREYSTEGDNTDTSTFSWEADVDGAEDAQFGTVPYIRIDSTKVDPDRLAAIERMLYGSDTTAPRLPTPAEILETFRWRTDPLADSASAVVTDSSNQAVLATVKLF